MGYEEKDLVYYLLMIRAEHSEDVVGVRGRVAFVRKTVFVFTGGFA